MPEGPEVELVRRELLQLVSKRVKKIQLTPLSQKYLKYKGKQTSFDQFADKTIDKVVRYGKFLVWCFEDIDSVILNHLGMTGRWCLNENLTDKPNSVLHPKVIVEMSEPPHGVFDDVRNFGQFKAFSSLENAQNHPPIRSIGIDGLSKPFPLEEFIERISNPRYEDKPVGELLLNQRIVAGIGNIYKAESLFLSRIHPTRTVKSLSIEEKLNLGRAIEETLQKALKAGGSTFGTQPYIRPLGEEGAAQNWHRVYGKKDLPCKECGSNIRRLVQKDRSTYFCPKCQK